MILRAIKAHAPVVKRVIVTSSCAAVFDHSAGKNGKRCTADDWNASTWEETVKDGKSAGYRASKRYTEKAGQFPRLDHHLNCALFGP